MPRERQKAGTEPYLALPPPDDPVSGTSQRVEVFLSCPKRQAVQRLSAQVIALGGNFRAYGRALNNLHDLPDGGGPFPAWCTSEANSSKF
jgi:hypothetical protein